MATDRNPFAELGFSPVAFEGLLDEEIRGLVKAQYRALAMLRHPDHHNGSTERFQALQEAIEKLEQDFEFQYWKDLFLRPRKDQLAELRQERDTTQRLAQESLSGLTSFWLAYCRGRELFYHRWSTPVWQQPKVQERLEGCSVFNPPPLCILAMDRFVLPSFTRTAGGPDVDPDATAKPFELRLISPGAMMRQNLVRQYFDPREKWRPSVRKEWIFLRQPPRTARSFYLKADGDPEPVPGKLLGSISNDIVIEGDAGKAKRRSCVRALISSDIQESDLDRIRRGFPLEEFKPFLAFIRPQLMAGRWMVTAEDDEHHILRLKILGYVRNIFPVEEGVTPREPSEGRGEAPNS